MRANTWAGRSQFAMDSGRGPDKCVDAVGLEATHGSAHIGAYDRVKQAVRSGRG